MSEPDHDGQTGRRVLMKGRQWRAGEILLVLGAGVATFLAGNALAGGGMLGSIASIWAANLVMLAGIYAGLRLRAQGWDQIGLRRGPVTFRNAVRLASLSVLVFVAGVAAFVAGAIVMANLVGMPEPADMSKYNYLENNLPLTLLALASVYFVSSFAEEVIYRGFLITRLGELFRGWPFETCVAVTVSSLLFGAVHSDWGLTGMVQATCMGIALGVSYLLVKRNLWVVILAHAYMDTLLILQMY